MSKQPFKVCFCFWRYFGLKKVEPPEDVKRLFQAYSVSGTMNIDNLLRFLTDFQGQVKATKEDAQTILDSLKHLNVIQRKGLHLEAFFRYLLGDYNLPLSSSHGDGSNEGEDYQDEDVQEEVPEYRRLIAIQAVKLKGNIENWLYIDSDKVKRLSLSEQELEDAAKQHGSQIVRFTQRNLLRVYPKGTRLDSSNYNPLVGWMHGAQMVAFNMQGYGKNLWRMQGMFRANGGCGYVKKPDILLNGGLNGKVFSPSEQLQAKITLKVKVYLGEGWHSDFHHTHFDKCSPPDFYTRVGIAGVPNDSVMKETKSIEDDWTPMWNTEFEFPLTVPELALLRVEVMEQDVTKQNDFGGQTCLPVPELRSGIRCVPLHNKKGEKYKSVKLLMSFKFV